ncbi:hypothetical protein BdWA1_000955 [Babesia duncani]|uniref:Uncharacterized protein n=1 Tax=Babesia duncani TaxID=323732 RepID=A0AAD9UQE7_9APIC|nr:hypothetical protein BdWA1_000955 [Babesia duncani]
MLGRHHELNLHFGNFSTIKMVSKGTAPGQGRCEGRTRAQIKTKTSTFDPLALDMQWAESVIDTNVRPVKAESFSNVSTARSEGVEKHAPESLASLVENIRQLSIELGTEAQLRRELQEERDVLKRRLDEMHADTHNNKNDADNYKRLMARIDTLEIAPDATIESVMDSIYTCVHESLGSDSKLTLALEDLADLHLKREAIYNEQNRQAQVINKVMGTEGLGSMLQQKTKIIDSLVEQLRVTKSEALQETLKLQEQIETLTQEAQVHATNMQELMTRYAEEKLVLDATLSQTKTEYKQLLKDQQALISQMAQCKTRGVQGDNLLKPTDHSHLQSLVEALYKKDTSNQKLLEQRNAEIQQLHSTIQRLEATIKDWEADAALWLDFTQRIKLLPSHD